MKQLRYFVAVAEELHFGRAAERVGIAQPPLTQQIQKLEIQLGCKLLLRGRKTALTEAGAVFLDEARQILAHMDRAVDAAQRAARGETGRLAVGVPPSVMLSDLPGVIRKYRARFPEVGFSLRELSTSAIQDAVRSGEIDLGFLRESQPAAPLESEIVLREPVVAVLPGAHRLARRHPFKLSALRNEPFVFFPKRLGPDFHAALTTLCSEAGFAPDVVQEATQWQTVISFVEAGMGVSIAPGCVRKFRRRGVVYKQIRRVDGSAASTAISVCWRAGGPTPAGARFIASVPQARRFPASQGTASAHSEA